MTLLFAVGLLTATSFVASFAAATPELIPVNATVDTKSLSPCKAAGIESCKSVNVDFTAHKASRIILALGKEFDLERELSEGGLVYKASDGSEAVITVNAKKHPNGDGTDALHANLNYVTPDKTFTVEPCRSKELPGCHVLIEEDEEHNSPSVEGIEVPDGPPIPHQAEIASPDTKATTVLTANFYYTDEFAAITDDIPGAIAQLVANANAAYAGSGLDIRLQSKCVEAMPGFSEFDDPSGMLASFRRYKGTEADTRNTADVALMVISKVYSRVCGIAYINAFQNGYSFGWVAKGCQETVTPHEIGHMFGCAHNKEISSWTPVGGFAYGKRITGGYATIMAYQTSEFPRKINLFSSPGLRAPNGQPTGTTTEDNKRAHEERRTTMAALGNELGTCRVVTPAPPTPAPTPPPCIDASAWFCGWNTWWCCGLWNCFGGCVRSCGRC